VLDDVIQRNVQKVRDLDHSVETDVNFSMFAPLHHENKLATRRAVSLDRKLKSTVCEFMLE